jgi:hypothetical protein
VGTVNEGNASPTAVSTDDAARRAEGQGTPAAIPPRPEVARRASNWTGGRVATAVIGGLLILMSLGLLGCGGVALWADRTQRDAAGYVTTGTHRFSPTGSALATERIELGSPGVEWLYSGVVLGEVRIRVAPESQGSSLFVGIARSADVDRYLAGVEHTLVSDFWSDDSRAIGGDGSAAAPGTQRFWVASATGPGARTLTWDPANGTWTIVVMNADGRPGIGPVAADLGAKMPVLVWIAVGSLGFGALLLIGGVALITGAVRRANRAPA